MWFFTKAACGSAFSPLAARHGLWLIFFGLSLGAFDFLGGFPWLRSRFLALRAWVYAAIQPSTRALSVGDYWLISILLLVAALTWTVLTQNVVGAPTAFFIYATLGFAVILRLYLVIYAVEKTRLSKPPKRTADRLLARLSTERSVWVGEETGDRPRRRKPAPVSTGLRLMVLAPLTYVWQTVVGLISVVIWALYSPILIIALTPGKPLGLLGVAIALFGFWAIRTCR
jgi:hypothetical protein